MASSARKSTGRYAAATLWASALALGVAGAYAVSNPSPGGSPAGAAYQPGRVFEDPLAAGGKGPSLVVVPAGQFIMGSPESEAGRYAHEGPQHTVRFRQSFSLGRTEVTVGEFRKFVESSGYLTAAERSGGSMHRDPQSGEWTVRPDLNWRHDSMGQLAADHLPVVHVAWEDAQAYVSWLSVQSGQRYRLPTEAELEYANRAGTTTTYSWGTGAPSAPVANIKGAKDLALMPAEWQHTHADEVAHAFKDGPTETHFEGYGDGFGTTSPVGSFAANAFGLHDTTGNVWEWTADCWHDSYQGAPRDGSAWTAAGDCGRRILKGGSFYCYPRHLRSAHRWPESPSFRNMYVGFRVARDI